MKKFKNGIGLRLLRYVFGCYLIVALLITAIQLHSEYRDVKRKIFYEISEIESTFKGGIMNAIWSFDSSQLDVILSGMKKIDAVSGIKIVSERDEILASLGDVVDNESTIVSELNLANPKMKEIEIMQGSASNRQTLYEYAFPLERLDTENGPYTLIGFGHIYTDVNIILDRVKFSFLLIVIFSIIKTASLWLFFLFFVNKFVAKPLEALANAASALNPEKLETLNNTAVLDKVINAKHDDELHLLATNFNHMRIAIVDKMTVIESQKNKLEERVQARTKSLLKANDELKHLALHDALTSLPNRTLFQDRLNQHIVLGQRKNQRFVVANIDLTKFKEVNDNYGHQIGDLVLVEVAKRLSAVLRKSDTVARMGGDEFYAIFAISNQDDQNGEAVINKFTKALEPPVECNTLEVKSLIVGANIGTAVYPKHGEDAATLVKNADLAMYHAKRANVSHVLYSPDTDLKLRRQAQLSYDFNTAIENNELFLVYQPILDVKSKKINKVEALVRWQHPQLGLISPVEFIPICERNGSIYGLTQWVFQRACNDCQPFFKDNSDFCISINLSGKVFSQPEIPKILENLCLLADVAPANINLEVTETTTMEKPEQAIDILNQLTSKGFSVSIDDFGTGYSSFSYLIMFPVKELKIDKSFLLNMGHNSEKVIKAMIDLAHSLNMKVVGEGVESDVLLKLLESMHCDYAQGFHISKPITITDLQLYLDQN